MWQAITGNDLRYIQFTPCLFTGEKQTDPWGLHATSFASFYQRLFVLWLDAFRNGQYYSIKFFDDMIRRIAFGEVNVCGLDGVCRPQLVIEADGSVYPCDFDCLDDSFLGNIRTTSVGQLFLASADAARRRDTGTGDLCRDCRYYVMCGGGCCRMRENICYAANDRICGMKLFLDDSISNLTDIAVWQEQIGRYSDLR